MVRRHIALVLAVSMLFTAPSCTSVRNVSMSEFRETSTRDISSIVLVDSSVVEFSTESGKGAVLRDGKIIGFTAEGALVRIPAGDVLSVRMREFNAGETALLVVGTAALVGYVVLGVVLTNSNFGLR